MFAKVLPITICLAYSQALELGHATSYSIFNHFPLSATFHTGPSLFKTTHIPNLIPISLPTQSPPIKPVTRVPKVAEKAPVVQKIEDAEVYPNTRPHYSFAYGVQDTNTGDIKHQYEERDGDVVKGAYSLLQPDGATRTVHYTADDQNGFNAQVEYAGVGSHPPIVGEAIFPKPIFPKIVFPKSIFPNKTLAGTPLFPAFQN